MQTIKKISGILFMILMLGSCIERYYYDAHDDFEPKMVIEGMISDGREVQEVIVSSSVSPDSGVFLPMSGCIVEVSDEHGNIYSFSESESRKGVYLGVIDKEDLTTGSRFKLNVTSWKGKQYESSFEEMPLAPPIDSISYRYEVYETAEDIVPVEGLQFYIDLNTGPEYSDYYRWKLVETFEYHSSYPIQLFLDEQGNMQEVPVDYSVFTCYSTKTINVINILSTQGVSGNRFSDFPLCFVSDRTQRLKYNYSLLVEQYAISQDEYRFWERLKKNNKEDSDMFSKQPAAVQGNLKCISSPGETVLGYFSVTGVSEKRIVLKDVDELSFSLLKDCSPIKIEMGFPEEPRPLYLLRYNDDEGAALGWLFPECIDCRLKGGVTTKPIFFE
ncbi:DUF4249 domain-containing protein [Draconibacterium sp.]|uniref:DUF4249 domain-containing protein n=1 Tax=Draconibacterium sp. TaxID=1965318 RepID=UPI0035697805